MKKVLHILNSLLPSGAETMLEVASVYWDNNSEHHILATKKCLGEYSLELQKAGYTIHHIYDTNFFNQHVKVINFIKKEKFEVVHVHREGQALYYEIDALIGGANRVVRTVHNVFNFKGLLRLRRIITRKLSSMLNVKRVAIGLSVYENEKKQYFANCKLIDNWFNEEKYTYTNEYIKNKARAELGISPSIYCMISVGNCSEIKNHMAILYAIKKLSMQEDEPNFLYLHVGKGEQEEEELQYIITNGLEKFVRYVGFQDPLLYLQAANLYIMPSIHEGLAISSLEAMAIGLPCLLTDVPGLKDFKQYSFENVQYCDLDENTISQFIMENVRNGVINNSKNQSDEIRVHFGIKRGVDSYQRVYFS